MIRIVPRQQLDVEKYNHCIENSLQSNIFGFSWYLDIVADNWSVLVLDDYDAVMPVPWRKKFFIKYTYQPFWVIQLGIYSKEIVDENEFLIELFSEFKYTSLRMNALNAFSMFSSYQIQKKLQVLSLEKSYEQLLSGYNRNRKRELKRAFNADVSENWNDNPKRLIELFEKNVGKRVTKISSDDYLRLYKLMNVCIEKRVGELLTIYDGHKELISGAFFLKHKNRITELVCSSDFKNRNNGANTFLNDRALFKYQRNYELFDFGGSSMKNIAKYYYSFGAKDEFYMQLHCNKLPRLLRLFKR
ncbi:hypothetical protein EV195_10210 [Tenacibaculum skagerrakense]|uniref:Acetyltransferase (GNAT) family protein n=1 Tax=Tenacibaculum skagerrakense TaxID=186571 RepID=A0A4R2NXB3_9FLAO|nr:hypothetical protein [Tenacibaculum skagerrakense]TCP26672.1 hypothetical protein EV195_10210 [Tenacibaculum skagerrakense]